MAPRLCSPVTPKRRPRIELFRQSQNHRKRALVLPRDPVVDPEKASRGENPVQKSAKNRPFFDLSYIGVPARTLHYPRATMEISYAAYTDSATFMLDAKGIVLWVAPSERLEFDAILQ